MADGSNYQCRKVSAVLATEFRDAVDVQDVSARLYNGEKALHEKCLADQDFIDLINGYTLVKTYYDDYRRRVHFGFDAPFRDNAKKGAIEVLGTLEPNQVRQIVEVAWNKVVLTRDQRRQLKRLALVALEHERIFDDGFDKVAADILAARWQSQRFEGWHELQGFPKPSNACYGLWFDAFQTGITSTLFDFWYMRFQEGTKQVTSAAFQVLAEA